MKHKSKVINNLVLKRKNRPGLAARHGQNPVLSAGLIPCRNAPGLVNRLIIFRLALEAEGHGTDSVITAYHHFPEPDAHPRPLVKIVATAVSGGGGFGGQEGPITQIGGGADSVLADLLRLRPAEAGDGLRDGLLQGVEREVAEPG